MIQPDPYRNFTALRLQTLTDQSVNNIMSAIESIVTNLLAEIDRIVDQKVEEKGERGGPLYDVKSGISFQVPPETWTRDRNIGI